MGGAFGVFVKIALQDSLRAYLVGEYEGLWWRRKRGGTFRQVILAGYVLQVREQEGILWPQPGLSVPRCSRSPLHPPHPKPLAHLLPQGQAAEAANLWE